MQLATHTRLAYHVHQAIINQEILAELVRQPALLAVRMMKDLAATQVTSKAHTPAVLAEII